jgi:hypothetical protein
MFKRNKRNLTLCGNEIQNCTLHRPDNIFYEIGSIVRITKLFEFRLFEFQNCSNFKTVRISKLFEFKNWSNLKTGRITTVQITTVRTVQISKLFEFQNCLNFKTV